MTVHTKADEDSVAIAEAALRDLAKAGATLIDPGPGGALFQDALADILPALDSPTLAAVFADAFAPGTDIVEKSVAMAGKAGKLPAGLSLRVIVEHDVPAPGEVRFALERYLRDRGDANIRNVADLIATSTFYNHAPIAGVTLAPKGRLEDLLTATERLTRKSDGGRWCASSPTPRSTSAAGTPTAPCCKCSSTR
jgi:hypothetical protein